MNWDRLDPERRAATAREAARPCYLTHLEQFDGIVIDPVVVAQGIMEFERHVSTKM